MRVWSIVGFIVFIIACLAFPGFLWAIMLYLYFFILGLGIFQPRE